MKLTHQSRLQLKLQKVIFLLLFISCIGMLAWISNFYSYQFDLTANKRHSLSDDSIELLTQLDDAVTVNAYTSDEVTRTAINEIIGRYQQVKTDFGLRLLNPDIDIEQAKKDGIVMNQPFAFVIYYKGRMEHIASLSEQAISNALLRLNRRDNQGVVFLRGHGERSLDGTDNRAYSKLQQQLIQTGFELHSINLLEGGLPQNTKLLVIAAPQHDYLEGELDRIMQFINAGGNLLWLADPGSLMGLDKLATSLGLQLQDGIIIDNNPELRQTLNIQHPAIIPVTEYFPHAITNTIRYNSLMPLSRGISPLTNENSINNWQAHALFNSAGNSWSEAGGLSEEMVFDSASGDIAGPVTIAVALSRIMDRDMGHKLDAGTDSNSTLNQRVIVVGDSDFLADSYIGAGANLDLGMNMFNWLIGDDDLISIESKASPDTKLALDDTQLMAIGLGFFLVLPLLFIILGFRIWYVRKSR